MNVDHTTIGAFNAFIELAKLDLSAWDPEVDTERYKIVSIGGCALVFGMIPLHELPKLLDLVPSNSVLDTNVARMAGAHFATGMPNDLAQLSAILEAPAISRERDRYSGAGLSEAAVRWLAIGERGNSADALFFHLSAASPCELSTAEKITAPRDASDFRRCRIMLEQVPELRERFLSAPSDLSPAWGRIWSNWAALCATMDSEHPEWRTGRGKAPQLTARLRPLLDE